MTAPSRSFTFDWLASEHAQVVRILTRELFGSGVRRLLKWFLVALLVMGMLMIVAAFLLGDPVAGLTLAPFMLLVGLWFLFTTAIGGRLQAWQVRRNDPNVAHPFTHSLSESGLHIAMKTTEVELKWSGVLKIRETPELFMFYYSKRCAWYLPKRVIGSKADVDEIRNWIRDRIPASIEFINE